MGSRLLGRIIVFFFSIFLFLQTPLFSIANASYLLLNPPFGNIEAGKDLIIDVVLQAKGEKIDGVDVVISFDSKTLKVKEVKKGKFFANYSKEVIEPGQLKFSALSPSEGLLMGDDVVVATIVFEIYASGETSIDLAFNKDSTTDSNVVLHEDSKDSLSSVKNGRYLVAASPEKIKAAKRAAAKSLNPLPVFVLIIIVGAVIVWYILKNRKPKEEVFIPEPFPLDRPPKLE